LKIGSCFYTDPKDIPRSRGLFPVFFNAITASKASDFQTKSRFKALRAPQKTESPARVE
jgi:hypothetical protein